MRQAVISVYKNNGGDTFSTVPETDIIFRQAFHDLGLAFSFDFSTTYKNPFASLNLIIDNPSNKITEAFSFDPLNMLSRPKIEVRAGDIDFQMTKKSQISDLKARLPLIYTGHPYYFTETKRPGVRMLQVQAMNYTTSENIKRVTDSFAPGTPVLTILKKILSGYKTDFTDVAELASHRIKNNYYINGLRLTSQVLPDLARLYDFGYHKTESSVYKFFLNKVSTPQTGKSVKNTNGMIEYPVSINWSFWSVKTFFGRPAIFYPSQWMSVDTTNLNYSETGRNSYNYFGKKDCLIVAAKYTWNDAEAEIDYTVSPAGSFAEIPILGV